MEFTRLTILLAACTLMFAVCALGSLALHDGPNNATVINNTVPALPAKTIPVYDIQIESEDITPINETPINETPINETPIMEQMQVKERAQLGDEAVQTDDAPIEETPLVDNQETIIYAPSAPVITEPPTVTQERPIDQTQPIIEDSLGIANPATTEPAVTAPVVTQEKPINQPINTGVKWCHTDEKLTYTGDYYTVTAGSRGEVYLGAINKNTEFIIIPVKK